LREKNAEKVAASRLATVMFEHIKPFLDNREQSALIRLKNLYRTGNFDEKKMWAFVGELCTVDDLKQEFQQTIVAGQEPEGDL
jgi:hypothetical protein